jgi:hypothetical protein
MRQIHHPARRELKSVDAVDSLSGTRAKPFLERGPEFFGAHQFLKPLGAIEERASLVFRGGERCHDVGHPLEVQKELAGSLSRQGVGLLRCESHVRLEPCQD